MARVEIDIPEHFPFSVELPILISHVNRGDHLGNEHLIALLNEARLRFMDHQGVDEFQEQGYLFVVGDLAVIYKSEGKYGESLCIEVAVQGFHKYGCDIVYRVTESVSGRLVAFAKTAHLVFDSSAGKATLMPADVKAKLSC